MFMVKITKMDTPQNFFAGFESLHQVVLLCMDNRVHNIKSLRDFTTLFTIDSLQIDQRIVVPYLLSRSRTVWKLPWTDGSTTRKILNLRCHRSRLWWRFTPTKQDERMTQSFPQNAVGHWGISENHTVSSSYFHF
jgi:hypothetical protein